MYPYSHRQVIVALPTGPQVGVDEEMVDVIKELWRLDLHTTACCQGSKGPTTRSSVLASLGYVAFGSVVEAALLYGICHDNPSDQTHVIICNGAGTVRFANREIPHILGVLAGIRGPLPISRTGVESFQEQLFNNMIARESVRRVALSADDWEHLHSDKCEPNCHNKRNVKGLPYYPLERGETSPHATIDAAVLDIDRAVVGDYSDEPVEAK